MSQRKTISGRLGRVAAALACAALLAGCSWTPDWANPVNWYNDTVSALGGDDTATQQARDDAQAKEKTSPGTDKAFPKLASVPDRPKNISAGEGAKVQQALVADRADARYQALGPGDAAATSVPAGSSSSDSSSAAGPSSAPPPVVAAPPPPPGRRAVAQTEAPPASPPPPPIASAATALGAGPAQAQAQAQAQPSRHQSGQQIAERQQPAAPAAPSAGSPDENGVQKAFDEALREQESPTVSPAVAGEGIRDMHASAVPLVPPGDAMPIPPERHSGITLRAPTSAQTASIDNTFRSLPASRPVGTVFFASGSSKLSGTAINELKNIASLYKGKGGKVRVVGHASSWTRNTDPLKHQLINFQISFARARAVARELGRLGVPRKDIAVTAVADNEPVYYEFMPAGEAGNRRAEIFLDH